MKTTSTMAAVLLAGLFVLVAGCGGGNSGNDAQPLVGQ